MNILIINASPRKRGVTSVLLDEFKRSINSVHNVSEVVRIQSLNIRPCIGCLKCRPDKTCILPRDDAHILADRIQDTDLLVVGSPVFWGNMPGTLKIFFDRNVPLFEYCEAKPIKYIPRPQLKGKMAILLVCGGTPYPFNLLPSQSGGTIRSLKTILKSGGIKILHVLNFPDTYNFEKKKQVFIKKVKKCGTSI